MAHYNAEIPKDLSFDPAIYSFFQRFYEISDTPGLTNEYVDKFTSDATFIMASKRSKGSEGMFN